MPLGAPSASPWRAEWRRLTGAQYSASMATYACPTCGMSVNATCGACDAPLVNDSIQRDDGSSVQVSKCPNGHGKIKSPMCCGVDMACSIA